MLRFYIINVLQKLKLLLLRNNNKNYFRNYLYISKFLLLLFF